jgi:thiol-disulfide isomerase/thioredoxin
MPEEKHKIVMIFATGCPQCATMRQTINSVIKHENIDAEVFAYNCQDDDSLDVALDYGISDVPGCYINGTVIEGEDYDSKALVEALKKLSQ